MLTATASSWWGHDYGLSMDGAEIGEFHFSWWFSSGTIILGNRSWEVSRAGWFGPFLLRANGRTVARATPSGWWRTSFSIACGERTYDLRGMALSGDMEFLLDRVPVGEVAASGCFTREFEAWFPEVLPTEVQVFILWVAAWRDRMRRNHSFDRSKPRG